MTGFTDQQKAALSAKLDAGHVKTRDQAGRKLSYIEGWHAIAEANRIFGFDGWSRETVETTCVWSGERTTKNGAMPAASYIARVRVTVGDIVREGTGAGSGFGKDHGEAHESAIKEAETDAMKRALMTFGNPFGLALYDKEQAEVERNGNGNGHTKPAAGKFDLLDPNGTKLGTYEKPDDWCDALRLTLTNFSDQGAAIWSVNKATAEVIRAHYTIAKWRIKGVEYHPCDVLQKMSERKAA